VKGYRYLTRFLIDRESHMTLNQSRSTEGNKEYTDFEISMTYECT